ncbi:MAG: chemotaxis protein CheA [Bacteriovoracaceae bacterium]
MEDFELELKQDFLSESDDLLADAENAFLRLTVGGANSELIDEIFRLAHNLKGTSKAVGFNQVSELTHIAENLILKIKEGERQVSNDIITVLLDFKDKVQEMIQGLKDDLEAKFDMGDIEERLEKMTSGEDGPVSEEVASEAESNESESNEIVEEVPSFDSFENEPVEPVFAETEVIEEETSLVNEAALESMKELGISVEEIGEPKKEEAPVAELKKPESPAPTKPQADAKKANAGGASEESIRVKLSRIDELNNVVGELVILQTALYQRRYEHIQDDLSNKAIGMMGKLFKEVQELSMSLRMLPLKGTFQKMTRIVRDTSKALGKEVKLHMVGEETEVDKTVLEKLADPLVHIVRNSVDHGLESNEQREETGKARVGNVELLAYHEGSNLVIQVTDDGKGIDPEVIKTKAIVKGIIDEYSQMSDQEIIQLIFHPGFSTKEQVTEVSGRGVGMDVVRTNIEALGGGSQTNESTRRRDLIKNHFTFNPCDY